MKRGFNILMILCVVGVVFSCDNNKSYNDYLKDERKTINRIIDKYDLDIIKKYPENGVFNEKEYVQLQNGVYLHVIDSGNGNRPIITSTSATTIYCRAKGEFIANGDTFAFDGFKASDVSNYDINWPLEFKYGSVSDAYGDSYVMSEGLASIMDYVGDSAVVSLIVPFRVGSYLQQQNYYPIYLERVRYVFAK